MFKGSPTAAVNASPTPTISAAAPPPPATLTIEEVGELSIKQLKEQLRCEERVSVHFVTQLEGSEYGVAQLRAGSSE